MAVPARETVRPALDDRTQMSAPSENSLPWSPAVRRCVGLAIVVYLAVVVLGPLTNPIGAPHLTTPLARVVSPVHQGLFLGHGYRFFGPDPGPSHTLTYEVTRSDGDVISGRLPDRDSMGPRLLYHRWFMLTETLFREGAMVPDAEQLAQTRESYDQQIAAFRAAGKPRLIQQLTLEREAEAARIAAATRRRDLLIESIARDLLARHGGQSVRLRLQVRELPTAEEVASGLSLDDPTLIQTIEIGTYPPVPPPEMTPLVEERP